MNLDARLSLSARIANVYKLTLLIIFAKSSIKCRIVESNKFDNVYSKFWNIFVLSIILTKFLKHGVIKFSKLSRWKATNQNSNLYTCEEKIKQEVGEDANPDRFSAHTFCVIALVTWSNVYEVLRVGACQGKSALSQVGCPWVFRKWRYYLFNLSRDFTW